MKHILEQRVYYSDTDAYGVVWHGAYLRWMEAGRVEFCDSIGLDLVELKNNDVVLPVTSINIRYKGSAKLDERIIVETSIIKTTPLNIVFFQTIKNAESLKLYTQAEVEVVAVNGNGRLYRKLPDNLKNACERVSACKD